MSTTRTTRPAAKKTSAKAEAAKASRPQRVSTAAARAKTIKVVAAKPGQETVYETLKKVWSVRGEILTNVKGYQMELKKADVVRVLKNLPRDAKSPYSLKTLNDKAHILA